MNNRSELTLYIAQLQRRLRLGVWLRGAAIFTATALTVTVALVLLLNRFAFPAHGVTAARLAILVALGSLGGQKFFVGPRRIQNEPAVGHRLWAVTARAPAPQSRD